MSRPLKVSGWRKFFADGHLETRARFFMVTTSVDGFIPEV